MKIDPYKVRPVPPRVGVLLDHERVLVEGAGEVPLAEVDPDVCVFGAGELVSDLLALEHGAALTWNGEPIRWRPANGPWGKNRSSDVRVLWLPFPARAADALEGFALWRDWLGSHGAAPLGSLGASGFSLLRATLTETLWTTVGAGASRLPIRWTIGGRQELGAGGAGSYSGRLEHWDMPAAYASTLGSLRYGGRWEAVPATFPFERMWSRDIPVYVRARVKVPELLVGPLPRRQRSRPGRLAHLVEPVWYPVGRRIQGVWTWDELSAASAAGCTLEHVHGGWVHVTGLEHRPFAPWWAAIEEGRAMPHPFASLLAKGTGNATWGQFAIRPDGVRELVRYVRRRGKVQRERESVPVYGTRPGAPDLAELLTGKVRSRLFSLMHLAGDRLLAAHTDGLWTRELDFRPEGWRLDDRASRLDVIGPQELRYLRPGETEPVYVVSGVPERLAPEHFAEAWERIAA